jgi:agmatinase
MDAALETGMREAGGLVYEETRRFLELVCTNNRLVGFDLVEVNPLYDPTQITALLADQLPVETLGLVFPGGRVIDNLGT